MKQTNITYTFKTQNVFQKRYSIIYIQETKRIRCKQGYVDKTINTSILIPGLERHIYAFELYDLPQFHLPACHNSVVLSEAIVTN